MCFKLDWMLYNRLHCRSSCSESGLSKTARTKRNEWGRRNSDLPAIFSRYHPIPRHCWDRQRLPYLSTARIRLLTFQSTIMRTTIIFQVFKLMTWGVRGTCLNLGMRLSIKWGGAQFIPTASTLLLLFITSKQSWKLSPEGALSPSTDVKQIQDGIWTFISSSNSTQACNEKGCIWIPIKFHKV